MSNNLEQAIAWLKTVMWPSQKNHQATKAAQSSMKCFLLALAAENLPSQQIHLDDLLVKYSESIECAMPTVGAHPDLVGFFPPQHKDLHYFTDVKKTRPFVVADKGKYAYECWMIIKPSPVPSG